MAGLPALASPYELAQLSGLAANDTRLVGSLREASRAFRGAVHHPVSRTTETVQIDGNGGLVLRLPHPLPIVSLVLRIDGEVIDPSRYRLNKRNGLLTSRAGHWPVPPVDLEADLVHGYDCTPALAEGDPIPGLPEDIQGVVLERAQIELNVTHGVASRSVLGDSITFGGSAVGSTQKWTDVVASYEARTGDRP